MHDDKLYKVTVNEGYICLKMWGMISTLTVDGVIKDVVVAQKESGLKMLLCDIGGIDPRAINLHIQIKGMELLWAFRVFAKVAVYSNNDEITNIVGSTVQEANMNRKYQLFREEDVATAWLRRD